MKVGVLVELALEPTRIVIQNGGKVIQSTDDLTNLEFVLTVATGLGGAILIPHGRPKSVGKY